MKADPTNPLKHAFLKLFPTCLPRKQHASKKVNKLKHAGAGLWHHFWIRHPSSVPRLSRAWIHRGTHSAWYRQTQLGHGRIPPGIHRASSIIYLQCYRANRFHLQHVGCDTPLSSRLLKGWAPSSDPFFVFLTLQLRILTHLYPGFRRFHLYGGLQRDVIRNPHRCFFKCAQRETPKFCGCDDSSGDAGSHSVPQPLHGAQPFWVREQSVCNKWQIPPRIKGRAAGAQHNGEAGAPVSLGSTRKRSWNAWRIRLENRIPLLMGRKH